MKKGWQTKRLADLVEVQNGYAFSSKDYSESGHFLMRIGNVQNGYISTADPKFIKLPADGSLQRFVLSEDDILVSLTGNVGRVGVIQESHLPAALNQRVARISISKDSPATRELLLLFLCSDWFREELIGAGHGAAQQNVSTKDLVAIEIPVPPLAEQQRIVGLLGKAFEGLAIAKANAEKNLQNARALFERHLQSVFTQRGPGWVEKHLKEVCEKITDGTHQTPKYFDEGIVFLSSRNVTSGTIDWDRIKYIDTKQHLEMHKRVAPRLNDILLAKNGTTGVAAIVDRDTTFDIYVSLALLRALPVMRPRFLLHFINSPAAKMQFNKRLKGIGVPNLHLEEIREVRLAFPADLEDQDRVVDELDDLRKETQRLARLYEQKLAALEALKKSLLHQAFTGKLL
jgi:type I restriction enzyme S subunit